MVVLFDKLVFLEKKICLLFFCNAHLSIYFLLFYGKEEIEVSGVFKVRVQNIIENYRINQVTAATTVETFSLKTMVLSVGKKYQVT